MKKIIIAAAATLAISGTAAAWVGGPFNGFGDGFGDGNMSFSMNTSARAYGNGYGAPYYGAPYYGYAPYAAPALSEEQIKAHQEAFAAHQKQAQEAWSKQ